VARPDAVRVRVCAMVDQNLVSMLRHSFCCTKSAFESPISSQAAGPVESNTWS
jgi:hypothetical protein